jgi:hypothetical protein
MSQPELKNAELEVRLRETERHERWVREAHRFHTKNLFGLWLLLVLAFGGTLLTTLVRDEFSALSAICLLMLALVVITGAYGFQEVARVHRRIDAILKLLEERDRK